MEQDYDRIINERAEALFALMAPQIDENDMLRLRDAFALAREAHAAQKRKGGEPYILHPLAVARIVAEDMSLGVDAVIAALLHDVVEDTDHTNDEIRRRFGADVARLVGAVTKQKKEHYEFSGQVDNYRQMLEAVEYDIRALLVKLADRLHNMRTLSAMPADKQMKIAGETDYFYAPLANRLGLYNIKMELENLSFRFRCPYEYDEIVELTERDRQAQAERLERFRRHISSTLMAAGIRAEVTIEYRPPYSIWRKMHKYGDDFNHLKYRHFTEIVYDTPMGTTEKEMALRVYAVLTDAFKEKPGGIINYIDSPKENGYQSFHVKLLADFGRWQEVHISSRRMVRNSKLGCIAERTDDNIRRWIEKFRNVLREVATQAQDGSGNFIEKVVTTFYNDDIMIFTPAGRPVVMPQKATVLDFAYELDPVIGEKAKYARINGFLASIKAQLRRGDVVEVFTDPEAHPVPEWLDKVVTYKARTAIAAYLASRPKARWHRCDRCMPIPGDEVVGFRDDNGEITIHRRDCPDAVSLASQHGDSICSVDYTPDDTLYTQTIVVTAVDRYHLLIDLVDTISNHLHLAIESINTSTADNIVTVTIRLGVHSFDELQSIISSITAIDGVDTVKRLTTLASPTPFRPD
ncbi:MAG: HD domain-containing protein [Muribaculaceae bacterium]|nr:HD domain-containing protein [Muribaculaceae bacterium]